ncbi:MAG: ABC transporter permease [Thermodesulfovibrionales bacterium]|nr:ABC transporter permease [Thermodesulfovibrionales bacterium]
MTEVKVVYVIIMRELIKFFREKGRLISTMVRPLIWLFFVGMGISRLVPQDVTGTDYLRFIFPGIIGMTVLFSAIFSSISIIWDKEFGFLKEILVAPVSRFSIVLGKALSGTILSTIQAMLIMILSPLIGIYPTLWDIVNSFFMIMLLSFSIATLGIVIASFYESLESFSMIMNFIVMPMFFLSGAMYPLKKLPLVLKYAATVNPLTYGIDGLKHILLNHAVFDFPLYLDILVLALSSLIFLSLSTYIFERSG